ncbi:hypothetical protein PIB30_018762 [Stylosanthes scabra]|uniref:SCP domain-containing protein n=1 Tax=Stylosanthes scabra TaxID=79078 RepID=A0ABU6Z6J8_9FABA|nr:hypothetical protein [Stylosanthes scabra]
MERPLKIIWILIISFVSIDPLLLVAHNYPEDYLIPHNNARAQVKVKPLNWDPHLASHARKFVEKHIADCKTGFVDESLASTYGYAQNYAYNPTSETGAKAVAGEVFARTHTRKEDREWVDKRSSDVNDAYDAELKRLQDERQAIIDAGGPVPPPQSTRPRCGHE